MNGLDLSLIYVGLITAAPLLLGAWLGSRTGGARTLSWLGKLAFAWGAGIAVAAYGLRSGWHAPWGLISPIIVGLLTAVVLRAILLWRSKRPQRKDNLGFFQRSSGAILGATIGFVLAIAGWQVALLTTSLMTPTPTAVVAQEQQAEPDQPKKKSIWAGLAEVAHDGFIQHLPVAGPVTDEALAVATILKTPHPIRKAYARHKGWEDLALLPSFQEIAIDGAIFEDIDAATAGNLLALYRLQRHPLIIEFYNEEELQAVISDLQASQVAEEMKEFRSRLADEAIE